MTIIACVKVNDGVLMAGDTLVCDGQSSIVGFRQKWVHGKKVSLAIAGTGRVIDLLQANVEKFKPDFSTDKIWSVLTALLRKDGWKPNEKEPGEAAFYNTSMLFATADRAISFCGAGGTVESRPFELLTRGSGGAYADGAWHALTHSKLAVDAPDLGIQIITDRPREFLKRSLRAAMHWDRGCGGVIQVWRRDRAGLHAYS